MTNKQFKAKLALLGINQTQCARYFNVSINTISTVLKRDKIPTIYTLAIVGLEQQLTNKDNKQ